MLIDAVRRFDAVDRRADQIGDLFDLVNSIDFFFVQVSAANNH